MALIGTIRKNGWILIVMMTLALGGFILMEIISNIQRNSAGDVNTMGKVNGEEINRTEFERYQSLIYNNPTGNPYQIREQVWNYFVERSLVNQETEAIGLGISDEEINDLQYGNNLSPIVVQRYGQGGQVDRTYLQQIKAALEAGQIPDPRFPAAWAEQEKEIRKQALQDKLVSLVTKALYTPKWQAEMVFKENNERIDFAYVRIPYDKIPDSEIQVTDADYKAYLNEFPKLHEQKEETRILSYAVLNVEPTSQDSMSARNAVEKLVEGLRNATNDSLYIVQQDGVYDASYKRKANLPASIADTLLRLPIGSVVGPYLDGGAWNIAKIRDRKITPDSVKARHILVKGETPAAERKIDSLRNLVETGLAKFDSLARTNSEDPGSAVQGGDLGFMGEGATVPEFNAVLFYTGDIGKLYKVKTQFGWHLIQIQDKKMLKNETAVKAVYLSQPIEPSKETQNMVKDRAIGLFQGAKSLEELQTLALQQNLQLQNSTALNATDYNIGGLEPGEGSRDMVRWAFEDDREVGDIAKEVFIFRDPAGGYFDSKYVIAALKSILPKGKASIALLKSLPEVEQKVKNRKRAEIVTSKLGTVNDLAAAAQQYGVAVDTAKATSMLQSQGEPRLVGTAFSLTNGQISTPIPGNGGVFIVRRISDPVQMAMPADMTMFRRQATSTTVSNVRQTLIPSMIRDSDLRDNRTRLGY